MVLTYHDPSTWSRAELRAEVERLTPKCDAECSYEGVPLEDCSLHGLPVATVWKIVRDGFDERMAAEARAEAAGAVLAALREAVLRAIRVGKNGPNNGHTTVVLLATLNRAVLGAAPSETARCICPADTTREAADYRPDCPAHGETETAI